jgi:CDP-diacylglycerol--glycerol-3-phosphate 3-phosphatidyltransferase
VVCAPGELVCETRDYAESNILGLFGIGGLCALIAGLFDMLDGMVARLSGTQSAAGVVLDSSLDRYVDFFFLAGLLIYYSFSPWLMIIVLAAILGSFMVSYSTAKAEALHVTPPRGMMKRTDRYVYLILGALLSPFSIYYLEAGSTFPHALAYPLLLTVSIIAIFANISAVQRLYAVAQAVTTEQQS